MGHGRLAEHSGEIEAYNPAGKTRLELEFAIELDANNVETLIDR